ncbi:MAG: cytochrome b N-terminal domain-containing protein [Rhodocyclaceae bacterium]|nr:cytochrome b N-terminal domain-containing protein [Rhodocyclaceae bacterium]
MFIAQQQKFFRACFSRAESVFNRVFGNKLNPFYHLGTIAFWQFWLVFGSGFYLYIFTDTGVHDAYDSVERITHDQWWLGGVLRSIHRYATNGMILCMVLHLLRHFAYDKYRGFRWFSWVSGVMLLWIVYITGINGFMLVWDQMAQFIVIAVAEWFDVLPMFNGTLIRNFLYDGSVNSRLFTLFALIHVGAPLATVLLMWIHVQRVPKAHINPPRQIYIPLTLAFVVLALIRPVLSQGGEADLSMVPTNLGFDWFELPVLVLVYVWDPMVLWALVVGVTLMALATPWIPQRLFARKGAAVKGGEIVFRPDRKAVMVRESETLLDAGLRQDLNLPFECRNGGCGVCKCTVMVGEVDPGMYQPTALSDEERRQGKVLMCCATAKGPAEIVYDAPERAVPIRQYVGKVLALDKLSYDVMRVVIELPEGAQLPFRAGQYLNIVLGDGERRAFSFANAPHEVAANGGKIELHIRKVEGGRFTNYVFDGLQVGDAIKLEGPLGDFVLRESEKPVVFVAGATGFAPVKSMVEDAFHRGLKRPIYLYWGVRQFRDLYMPELPTQWAKEHSSFKFIPVLSEPAPDDNWTGRTGMVHSAILEDFPSLQGHQIYACGSVKMVGSIFPHFRAQGADEGSCFSDAFTVSARSLALQVPVEKENA